MNKHDELFSTALLGSHVSSKIKQLSYQLSKIEKGYSEIETLNELELESLIGEYSAYFYDLFAIDHIWKQYNKKKNLIFDNKETADGN